MLLKLLKVAERAKREPEASSLVFIQNRAFLAASLSHWGRRQGREIARQRCYASSTDASPSDATPVAEPTRAVTPYPCRIVL